MGIVRHPRLGDIECVRSLRTRSIRLQVRADGTLRLTYPLFTPQGRAIAFAESKASWIIKRREQMANHPAISRTELNTLRREARRTIPALVATLAQRHGFRYTSLRISSARTRWGSCSGKDGISISLYVMLLPDHLREFIVLHELCHTRHHNHSTDFHALLDTLCEGKEKALNRELKAHKIPHLSE